MVVGQIKFIILQFKMFELESCIRGFMFNMYRGRRRGTSLRSEIANTEDPYVVAADILSKFRMNNNT